MDEKKLFVFIVSRVNCVCLIYAPESRLCFLCAFNLTKRFVRMISLIAATTHNIHIAHCNCVYLKKNGENTPDVWIDKQKNL